MNVKVKKSERQSIIPGIIAIIIFGVISIPGLVFFGFEISSATYDEFIYIFSEDGMAVSFGLVFFILDMYFVYMLFKAPKKYKATLISKIEDKYEGKKIYYMKFRLIGKVKAANTIYKCYTEEENDFVEKGIYDLLIKEFNWSVRRVDKILEGSDTYKDLDENPTFSITPLYTIFAIIIAIFGGGIAFLIVKIIYDIQRGNPLFPNFFSMLFCGMFAFGALFAIIALHESEKEVIDKRLEQDDIKIKEKLRKMVVLPEKYENGNKNRLVHDSREIFDILKVYIIVLLLFILLLNKRVVSKTLMLMILLISLPFIVGIIVKVFSMLSRKKKNDKVIKDNGFKFKHDEYVTSVENIKVKIPKKSKEEVYFITDSANNVFYQIRDNGIMDDRYIILDNNDNILGEIEFKLYKRSIAFFVRLKGKAPFVVRRKYKSKFDVYERSFTIEEISLKTGITISDSHGMILAYITGKDKGKLSLLKNQCDIELVSGHIFDEEVLLSAVIVGMSYFKTYDRLK